MCNTYIVGASQVRYGRCRNRARVNVGLSVVLGVTVSVSSTRVRVVVVSTRNVVSVVSLVDCQASR